MYSIIAMFKNGLKINRVNDFQKKRKKSKHNQVFLYPSHHKGEGAHLLVRSDGDGKRVFATPSLNV